MPQDRTLVGRMERRLPIIVVVSLKYLERADIDGTEWTYTDNISAHGARLFSRRNWQPGDEITLTPFKEETASGSVVYCQRIADNRYWIGVKLRDHPTTWRIIRRYDGIQMNALAESKPS
jgi:PilZ domain